MERKKKYSRDVQKKKPVAVEGVARLGYTVEEAMAVTGFSRTRIHGLIADGTIESKKFGKRRILLAGGPRGLHALFAPSVSP